jgi:sulfatase maturation enzyme AslB (radical SAM superfamily)
MLPVFYQTEGITVTIHTNTNCTLKCSYCYEQDKAASIVEDKKFWETTKHKDKIRNYNFVRKPQLGTSVISFDIIKEFIDNILAIDFYKMDLYKKSYSEKDGVILDFIGGDSLQYPELLDKTLTYFYEKAVTRNHTWMYNWIASISTNGVTLLNPQERKFCEKWKNKLSLGISIDGCPELHDLNQWCFANNADGFHQGSWQYIKEIWPWYKRTFPSGALRTKWTLAPNSYKHLLKSVKFLHEKLKMRYIMFNRVVENNV